MKILPTLNNNFPIIEIEGIDGSGKTTIAKALASELGLFYLKLPIRIIQKSEQTMILSLLILISDCAFI